MSLVRRGDTMIEVMFAVAFFGMIAILSISMMNNGLAESEDNLEATMARDEMNAQAEALRFIHSTYAATSGTTYNTLWHNITDRASTTDANRVKNIEGGTDCEEFYKPTGSGGNGIALSSNGAFALNVASITNNTSPIIGINGNDIADTYPIVSTGSAKGIWVNVLSGSVTDGDGRPFYYDFYIRSCWYGIGSNTPTTLDTVIRLYNPDRNL